MPHLCSSNQFSRSIVSDSCDRTARLPCPSPTPRAYWNSCPLSQWCHQTISSSVIPFSSNLQSFPASGSFRISQFFTSGGQSIGVSASASVLPKKTQGWSPLGWTGWISLLSKGLKRLLQRRSSKALILLCSVFLIVQLSHPYLTTGKTIVLTRLNFDGRIMSLLFNMPSRLVIVFIPRNKHLLISWLQSPSAVILEPPRNKVCQCFHCFPTYLPWSDGTRCHDLSFLNVEFKPTFSLSSFTFINRLFSPSSLSAISLVPSAYLRLLIFLPAMLTPVCASSSPAFQMMDSAYKLNKHGDNIQPWRTSFPFGTSLLFQIQF